MNSIQTAEDLANALSANRSGNGWITKCPAHDDKNPSLSISEGENGKVLLYCHAGCSYEAITDSLRFERRTESVKGNHSTKKSPQLPDAFDEQTSEFKLNMKEADYQFLTEDRLISRANLSAFDIGKAGERYTIPISNLENRVIDIRLYTPVHARKPSNAAKMMPLISGTEAVLFPVSSIKASSELPIYICEGEWDALALKSAGYVAITNTCGAGTWKSEWNENFKDRDVVIVMDNDPAGTKGAKKRATSLFGCAKRVKIVNWPSDRPEGHDVIDELRDFGENSLKGILEKSLPYKDEYFVRLSEVETVPVSWLWKPYLPRGAVTILNGEPGKGKSFASLSLAAIVSTGGTLPDNTKIDAQNVLLISAEDPLDSVVKPRFEAQGGDSGRCHAFTSVEPLGEEALLQIERHVKTTEPALIVIDPFNAYFGKDANKADNVRPFLTALRELAVKYDLAILMIHHWNKGGQGAPRTALNRQLGSVDITASCRSILALGASPDDDSLRCLVHTKSNLAPNGSSLGYRLVNGKVEWTGKVNVSEADIFAQPQFEDSSAVESAETFLSTALADGKMPSTQIEIAATMAGISKSSLTRAKKKLNVVPSKVGTQWFCGLSTKNSKDVAQDIQDPQSTPPL